MFASFDSLQQREEGFYLREGEERFMFVGAMGDRGRKQRGVCFREEGREVLD